MKRSLFLFGISLLLSLLFACRKDKSDPPDNTGGEFTPTEVQVILPAGSTVDLATTTIFTLSKVSPVSADGKSSIPFNAGATELAYLFDASGNVLMMGFISGEKKQISTESTAEALLYFGLGVTYSSTNAERIASLKRISTYSQFAAFKSQLEQAWAGDPLMLSGNGYVELYAKTVGEITKIPIIDVKGKQIKVENADDSKSGLLVRPMTDNDESIEIENHRVRRAHAYLYKTAYKQKFGSYVTLINTIYSSTAFNEQLAVRGGIAGGNRVVSPTITGPVVVPLQGSEVEAIWKIRIVGPGKASNTTFTADEATRLEQLWVEFFALDLLMPNMLTLMGHTEAQYEVRSNNPELARAFIDEVKSYLNNGVMDLVKNGEHIEAIKMVVNDIEGDYYKRVSLQKKLLSMVREVNKAAARPDFVEIDEDIDKEAQRTGKLTALVTKLNDGVEIHLDDEIERIYTECNTMEEWTVKIKDDDVNVTPKHSQTMRFTNHVLTVSASPELASGQTLEYDWTTAGSYGLLKSGTSEGTSFTTTGKNITYYGKDAPGDDNIEKVIVSAYIKTGTSREFYGSDTATINVKKVKIVMTPNGATLAPVKGIRSIKLRLLNADGTNPIINNSSVEYKVEWSTAGSYGHFTNNTTMITTSTNEMVYTATDEDVPSAMENITANVYFKLSSTGWMLRETVKGTVKVVNDTKKVISYGSSQSVHKDANNWCYVGCIIRIPDEPNAISYAVTNAATGASLASWNVTGTEARWHGDGPGFNDSDVPSGYVVGVNGSFTWGGSLNPNVPQTSHGAQPTCGGTYQITVTVSQ